MMQAAVTKTHPAAQWAAEQSFSSSDIDCTTAVVLKILDGKCNMLPGEMAAIMEIYDVVRRGVGVQFTEADHRTIDQARVSANDAVLTRIHRLRVHAESQIPKPVMKAYKARLHAGLFG
jgi:hypothetical protein